MNQPCVRVRRFLGLAAAFAGFLAGWGLPRAVFPQGGCRPPKDLRVCQDVYAERGRVFLVWTNGETTYTKVRVYLDGEALGEVPGESVIVYVTDVSAGPHAFAVEGFCGATPTERASASFTVLEATPHTRPIESIECTYDEAQKRLVATWVLSSRVSIFIDVYIRRAGVAQPIYVITIFGDSTRITINGVLPTDQLRLQFFDEDCYGSELTGCPGPSCFPPIEVRVCQDLYSPRPRVFIDWLPGAADYSAFQIFVDGVQVDDVPGLQSLFYVESIDEGRHTFGVRGRCGEELTEIVTRTFDVLMASPHMEPFRSLHCQRDTARGTITATWLPGAAPSAFIDVYVRHPGDPLLDFAGTIAGDSTRVRLWMAEKDDQLVLQFFDQQCYGSPLFSCGDEPGSRSFLRGDANGSGRLDLSDGIFILKFLFVGDLEPLCLDAADANDDGKLDIADPVFDLNFLFTGGPPPPPPGPTTCGPDPTADGFRPCLTAACP